MNTTIDPTTVTKRCAKCKEEKIGTEFNKDKQRKFGLSKYCRDCARILTREFKERRAARLGKTMKPYQQKKFSKVSEEELLEFLRDFYNKNNRPPSTEDLYQNPDYPCYHTYYRRFKYKKDGSKVKTWDDIIELSGLKPLDYDKIWRAWQYLVEKSCEKLIGKCDFQVTYISDDFRPDVVCEEKKLIVDAATSNYDCLHKKRQFKKAKDAGYKVEYWCLYKTSAKGINEPDLKYVFSGEIANELKKIGEVDLAEDILSLLDKQESFAEKILKHRSEYILTKIKEMAALLGRVPKTRDFINNRLFPSATTITQNFGTFNCALELAGFDTQYEKMDPHDRKVAIDELISLTKKLGRVPKYSDIGYPHTTYTAKIYTKYYGGIKKCLEDNGVDIKCLKENEKQVKFDQKIAQIILYVGKNERLPGQKDFRNKNNLPSSHWVYDHFESYDDLFEYIKKKIG